MKLDSYQLLDFGAGEKIERFGDKTIVRPSSQASTERRFPELWSTASAIFSEESGWRCLKDNFTEWRIDEVGFSLVLRLQQNGQVGLFPEHASYLSDVCRAVKSFTDKGKVPHLLNLFAYTGMCSIVAAKAGASVSHVDSSKASLDWAKQNFELNDLDKIRLIREEALSFLKKEVKRKKRYQIIVLDPPGFSRFKEGTWNLSEVMAEIATLCRDLLDPESSSLFFTFHGSDLNGEIIRNLLLDKISFAPDSINVTPLCLNEQKTGRRIPAGTLVFGTV